MIRLMAASSGGSPFMARFTPPVCVADSVADIPLPPRLFAGVLTRLNSNPGPSTIAVQVPRIPQKRSLSNLTLG